MFGDFRSSTNVRETQDIKMVGERGEILGVEDPALTLVRCNDLIFLAVVKVVDIRVNATSQQTLPAHLLHEPHVRIRSQIMRLSLLDSSHQPEAPDWEWVGLMEPGAAMTGLKEVDGNHFDLVDADLAPRTCGYDIGSSTYVFRTGDLRALAAILYERLKDKLHCIPLFNLRTHFHTAPRKGESLVFMICEIQSANCKSVQLE